METKITNFDNINFVRIDSINNPDSRLIMANKLLEGYKYYLSFGTALGFHRDKDFIPEDSDIDISLPADKINPEDVVNIFKQYFFLLRLAERGGKIHQAAFQDDDGFIVDLQFFYKGISYCEGGRWEHKFKIKEIDTKYGTFPFPEPIEKYLTDTYGNWKVKSQDKAIKK